MFFGPNKPRKCWLTAAVWFWIGCSPWGESSWRCRTRSSVVLWCRMWCPSLLAADLQGMQLRNNDNLDDRNSWNIILVSILPKKDQYSRYWFTYAVIASENSALWCVKFLPLKFGCVNLLPNLMSDVNVRRLAAFIERKQVYFQTCLWLPLVSFCTEMARILRSIKGS